MMEDKNTRKQGDKTNVLPSGANSAHKTNVSYSRILVFSYSKTSLYSRIPVFLYSSPKTETIKIYEYEEDIYVARDGHNSRDCERSC